MRTLGMPLLLLLASPALAWDGFDWESGGYVEIEDGNLVREGEDIEFYDYNEGEYRTGTVEDIDGRGYGSDGADVEVYDHESGEYRTFDMD